MSYSLSGNCYNSRGAAVASATVKIFDTATDTLQATTTSNSGGAYVFTTLTSVGPYYAVAYHANSPDIAGTTLNTLLATPPTSDGLPFFPLIFK